MRIDPKSTVVSPVAAKTVRDAVSPKQKHDAPAAVVELSSAGSSMVGKAESDASAEKVARIRAMLQAGTYKVDLDTLAARICEDEILGRSDQ